MTDDDRLSTPRLRLRPLRTEDAAAVRDYYARNAGRFERWEAPRSRDVADHARAIEDLERAARSAGHASRFGAFIPDGELVGILGLSSFDRHQLSASIDYTIDAAFEGRGYASEAVAAVLEYAFERTGLRSVSAYYDEDNVRSGALLARLGFAILLRMPPLPGPNGALRSQILAIKRKPDDG